MKHILHMYCVHMHLHIVTIPCHTQCHCFERCISIDMENGINRIDALDASYTKVAKVEKMISHET